MHAHLPLKLAAAALALALLPLPAAEANHGTTQQKNYVGGTLSTFLNACDEDLGVGGVRFCGLETPAPATVTITLIDLVVLKIGARVKFVDADDQSTGETYLCGTGTLPVPAGSSELWIFLGSTSALGGCISNPGTRGTITVTWSGASGPLPELVARKPYTLAGSVRIGPTILTNCCLTAGAPLVDGHGGALFEANGALPIRVSAADLLTSRAGLMVCQNANNDLFCGGGADPTARGCGSVDLATSPVPFRPDLRLSVFVHALDTTCNAEAGKGTIAVTYAP